MKKCLKTGLAGVLFIALLAACSTETTTGDNQIEKTEKVKAVEDVSWSYKEETGPEYWDTLHPEFSRCAKGKEQAPIDIDLAEVKLDKDLKDIEINYNSTPFTLENNGHTLQLTDPTESNSIIVEDEEYKLLQLHFHVPSENTIDGQFFDMEGHLVHINEEGSLAVLGFLIKAGEENKVLKEVWDTMPTEKTTEDVKLTKQVDLQKLLPKDLTTFRFSGSLTTPPCTEGVSWILLEEPVSLSQKQIDAFSELFPAGNARHPQPLHGREVYTDSK